MTMLEIALPLVLGALVLGTILTVRHSAHRPERVPVRHDDTSERRGRDA